jgi:hypothetical protein
MSAQSQINSFAVPGSIYPILTRDGKPIEPPSHYQLKIETRTSTHKTEGVTAIMESIPREDLASPEFRLTSLTLPPPAMYDILVTLVAPDGTFTNTLYAIPIEHLQSPDFVILGFPMFIRMAEYAIYHKGTHPGTDQCLSWAKRAHYA